MTAMTMGMPEMLCSGMISRAWPTVSSGGRVTGSTMMPFSERLTLSTSRDWRSMGMISVDDADAALLGEGDGEAGFGDGVHGGGERGGC